MTHEDRPLTAGGRGFLACGARLFSHTCPCRSCNAQGSVLRLPNRQKAPQRAEYFYAVRSQLPAPRWRPVVARVGIAFGPGSPWTAACQHMAVAAAQPLLQQLRAEHQVAARGLEKVRKWHRLSATNL